MQEVDLGVEAHRPRRRGAAVGAIDVLRPDAEDDGLAVLGAVEAAGRQRQARTGIDGHRDVLAAPGDASGQERHLRRAEEPGDEHGRRSVEQLERRALLLDQPVAHQHDPVGQRHRLDLVVGHVDHRRRDRRMEALDLAAHLVAELGVEIGQRLVEQEDAGAAHDRPADRDALALAAGDLPRVALEQRRDAEHRRRGPDPLVDLGGRELPGAEPEADVPGHRHVRIERVVLEHHGDVAVARPHVVDDLAADLDLAVGDLLEAGNGA